MGARAIITVLNTVRLRLSNLTDSKATLLNVQFFFSFWSFFRSIGEFVV